MGVLVLAIVANADAELEDALATLADGLQQAATGTSAGLAALERMKGVPLAGEGKLSFAQLGINGRDFGDAWKWGAAAGGPRRAPSPANRGVHRR